MKKFVATGIPAKNKRRALLYGLATVVGYLSYYWSGGADRKLFVYLTTGSLIMVILTIIVLCIPTLPEKKDL
jgi:hypothetical protein